MAARGGGLGAALLAEDVVGELAAPVLVDGGGGRRSELDESGLGELADAILGHPQHLGQLLVGLPPLEDELDYCPLVGGELLEGGHAGAEL